MSQAAVSSRHVAVHTLQVVTSVTCVLGAVVLWARVDWPIGAIERAHICPCRDKTASNMKLPRESHLLGRKFG